MIEQRFYYFCYLPLYRTRQVLDLPGNLMCFAPTIITWRHGRILKLI